MSTPVAVHPQRPAMPGRIPSAPELMQRIVLMQQEIQRIENHRQQACGLLTALAKDSPNGELNVSLKTVQSIAPNEGFDHELQAISGLIRIKYKTAEQAAMDAEGIHKKDAEAYSIPKASPFQIRVTPPDGGRFHGDIAVAFKDGKAAGKPLHRVEKLPTFDQYTVDATGLYGFSTDACGFEVNISYSFKPALEEIKEPELEPCEGSWHTDPNAIGFRCPECASPKRLA
jgi:hypothetical protein